PPRRRDVSHADSRNRSRPVRGPHEGPDLGLHAERGPRSAWIDDTFLDDERRRRPRTVHSAHERQRDGAAWTDGSRPGAVRHTRHLSDHLPRILWDRASHDGGKGDRRMNALTAAYLTVALLALFGGLVTGVLQALEHAGINLYPWVTPLIASYYQGLTLHGVLNVLVWTTFFICGFVPFVMVRALDVPLWSARLHWITFGVMTGGLVLAAVPLIGNAATVMFTFYPPLRAHWAFYIGLTLVVVGTWLVTFNLTMTYQLWRGVFADRR